MPVIPISKAARIVGLQTEELARILFSLPNAPIWHRGDKNYTKLDRLVAFLDAEDIAFPNDLRRSGRRAPVSVPLLTHNPGTRNADVLEVRDAGLEGEDDDGGDGWDDRDFEDEEVEDEEEPEEPSARKSRRSAGARRRR